MMSIRVVSRCGEALGTPLAAIFADDGGDIGRGADCTLVLPDPERRLSRKHVLVTCREGKHFIRQIGANLDVELDGVPLAPGVEHALLSGAQLRIGPYVLQARAEAEPAAPAAPEASDTVPRPSVFSDLLHEAAGPARRAPAPAAVSAEVDLLIGDMPAPAGDDVGLHALYEGLRVPMPAAPTPEQLQRIGALLRAAIEGTLQLLAARTIAKRELGASPTLLQTRENNPLKFSPDADIALAHLLGPAQRGFIAPLSAVHEAFDDLRAHEMAVLAGMRAALGAVLARFDPAALEQRLVSKGVWDNVLPAGRKARLWERYGEQYAQLMQEVEDDFDSLFGRAFLKAYQAQLAALARAARQGEPE